MVTWTPPDKRIPLFVRNGGIIPMLPEIDNVTNASAQRQTLEIRHYGDAAGTFRLYDDDGETFAYETGAARWVELKTVPNAAGIPAPATTDAEIQTLPAYAGAKWIHMG